MVEEMDCNLFAPDDEEEEFIDNDQETGAHIDLDSKRLLVSPSTEEYDALVGKIRKLVRAGHGETLYEIGAGAGGEECGLNEDDMKASVATLHSIAEQLDCELNHLRDKDNGTVGEFLLREKKDEEDFTEVRV